jgi:hypothetical protein
MANMLIRPTEEELANYGKPDFTILNAGQFPAVYFSLWGLVYDLVLKKRHFLCRTG